VAVEDAISLTKARSMLIILLATCDQTLLAIDATANVLDSDLRHDLNAMIERTRREVEALDEKLRELRTI
jgi:hypothetical protein